MKPLSKLTDEDEAQIAHEYAEGASPKALMQRWRLTKPRFYRILRRQGGEPDGRNTWFDIEKHPRCCGCGQPIGGWGNKRPNGKAQYKLTCASPDCAALVKTNPYLVPEHRRILYERHYVQPHVGSNAGHSKAARARMRALTAVGKGTRYERNPELESVLRRMAPDVEIPLLKSFQLCEDRRGDNRTAAHDSVWSPFSRVPVFVRLISQSGDTALTVVIPRNSEPFKYFARKYLGPLPKVRPVLHACDYFLVWRCDCPQATKYEIKDWAADFPEAPGLYGLCPRCGAAALEIVEDSQ